MAEEAKLEEAREGGGAAKSASLNSRYPTLSEEIVYDKYDTPLPVPACLSGACDGADEAFGACALASNHFLVHFMGPDDEPSKLVRETQLDNLYWIPGELLSEGVEAAWQLAGSKRIKGTQRTDDWESKVMASRRNYCQVRRADAVYVVAWRMKKGTDPFSGRNEVPEEETPVMDLGGGTGWACQWYIDRFAEGGEDPAKCNLYLFQDPGPPWALREESTLQKWSKWDPLGEVWVPMAESPPRPSGIYAGIGGTILSEASCAAITALYR